MTRSIVSSATSTTLTVKQKFDNVRSMQKYNEEKEAEYEKVAKAMEEERQRRLEEQKVAKGKFFASKLWLTKILTWIVPLLQKSETRK